MRIISFGWTTEPFLAGEKTVTRRDWKESYAKCFKQNELLSAYDKDPRYGGKRIGVIKLVEPVKRDDPWLLPNDYIAEGFGWMDRNWEKANSYWHKLLKKYDLESLAQWWAVYCLNIQDGQQPDWCVRFEVVYYTKYAVELMRAKNIGPVNGFLVLGEE
jgi:hypothetical protein